MQVTAKSYLTAGAALFGASAIAVAPIQIAPPDIKVPAVPVSSAAVELTATVNPITAWLDVVSGALENGLAIGEDWLSNPAPILQQIIANQLGYGGTVITAAEGVIEAFVDYVDPTNPFGLVANLQGAVQDIFSGDISGGFEAAAQALILLPVLNIGVPLLTSGVLEIPVTMAQNFANVVGAVLDPAGALPLAIGALGSILGPINAVGDSIQTVVDSLGAGDPLSAIGAALSAPALVVGALINGYTNLAGTEFPGLLTFGENAFSSGVIQSLFVNLPRAIADAITPPAAPAAETSSETQALAAKGDPGDPSTGSGDLLAVSTAAVNGGADDDAEGAAEEAEGTEEAEGADAAEEAEGADVDAGTGDAEGTVVDDEVEVDEVESEESESGTGSTDLTDGNKFTPGDTAGGSEDDSDSSSSFDDAREALKNAAGLGGDDADADAADDAGAGDGGGDGDGGSNSGGSDGGSGGDA